MGRPQEKNMMNDRRYLVLFVAASAWMASPALAVSPAQKCEAAKLKIAGKYGFCRLKAEAKAIKTGEPVDYSKCDSVFAPKWQSAEASVGGACSTTGDQVPLQGHLTADANIVAAKLSGVRFVDNGDGTVTDLSTNLMWEKKDNLGGVHDIDEIWEWTNNTGGLMSPDGSAYSEFLGALNTNTSNSGATTSGCFAGHCDWRLPTVGELLTIMTTPCVDPCIDPIFGITTNRFWTSTTYGSDPTKAWFASFSVGTVSIDAKTLGYRTRAVRQAEKPPSLPTFTCPLPGTT